MKYLLPYIGFLAIAFGSSNLQGQSFDSLHVDGRIVARLTSISALNLADYDSSNSTLNNIINDFQIDSITQPFSGLNDELDRTFRFYFTDYSLVDSLINALTATAQYEYVEKEPLIYVNYVPNDPKISNQHYFNQIELKEAWDYSKGSTDIKIAIVDNAVSRTHEDLASNIWTNPNESNNFLDDDFNGFTNDFQGWDVADNDNDPNPPVGAGSTSSFTHGTHCAGIAAATTDNNIGVAGVGFNLSIIPVKCSPDDSDGEYLTNAYDGVYYATRVNADIISMSWGGNTGSFLTGESIINAAANSGIVLIAAAGNSNTDAKFYPAAYNNVIAVGSVNSLDQKSGFSNYGSYIDIMAPGEQIYNCLSGTGSEYGYKSGTSMACPIIAGIAGLMLADNNNLSPSQIEQQLKNTADNIDIQNPSYIGELGAGRVNARKIFNPTAVDNLTSFKSILPFPNPTTNNIWINTTSVISIKVFNDIGKLVHENSFTNNLKPMVSLELFAPGNYYIQVTSANSSFIFPIVKL